MSKNIEINFSCDDENIEVNLEIFFPESVTFDDTFSISDLLASADELDILPGEFLAKEILDEMKKLDFRVSYEAECDLIDECIEYVETSPFIF